MLTNFHKWYDQVPEPFRFMLALAIAMPLILGLSALSYVHSVLAGVICAVGVIFTMVLLGSRIAYIHRRK